MAFSFDAFLQPKPAAGNTYPRPPGGSFPDQVRQVVNKEVKGENNKPYPTMEFKGLVLYTSILTYNQFSEKYDKNFIQYCTGLAPKAAGKSPQTSQIKIIETIVYIQEICSCLPHPKDAEFFKKIEKINNKKGNAIDNLRSASKNDSKALRQLEQIERYPKAYAAFNPSDKTKEISLKTIVKVRFPHQFDFSYAVILK